MPATETRLNEAKKHLGTSVDTFLRINNSSTSSHSKAGLLRAQQEVQEQLNNLRCAALVVYESSHQEAVEAAEEEARHQPQVPPQPIAQRDDSAPRQPEGGGLAATAGNNSSVPNLAASSVNSRNASSTTGAKLSGGRGKLSANAAMVQPPSVRPSQQRQPQDIALAPTKSRKSKAAGGAVTGKDRAVASAPPSSSSMMHAPAGGLSSSTKLTQSLTPTKPTARPFLKSLQSIKAEGANANNNNSSSHPSHSNNTNNNGGSLYSWRSPALPGITPGEDANQSHSSGGNAPSAAVRAARITIPKLKVALIYVRQCVRLAERSIAKGMYKEAASLFLEHAHVMEDVALLRYIADQLIAHDYYSAYQNSAHGAAQAGGMSKEDEMWEKLRKKPIIGEDNGQDGDKGNEDEDAEEEELPYALRAYCIVQSYDTLSDVCAFYRLADTDPFSDQQLESSSDNNSNSNKNGHRSRSNTNDTLYGILERLVHRVCYMLAAPCVHAGSVYTIYVPVPHAAPPTEATSNGQKNADGAPKVVTRLDEKKDVAGISVYELMAVRERLFVENKALLPQDKVKKYRVANVVTTALFSMIVYVYQMTQLFMKRRLQELETVALESSPSRNIASSASSFAENPQSYLDQLSFTCCDQVVQILYALLIICEGSFDPSFLSLATTPYLPFRIQLQESLAAVLQHFGYLTQAAKVATRALLKTRELMDVEYLDVVPPDAAAQDTLERSVQQTLLLHAGYSWLQTTLSTTAAAARAEDEEEEDREKDGGEEDAAGGNGGSSAGGDFLFLEDDAVVAEIRGEPFAVQAPESGAALLDAAWELLVKHGKLPREASSSSESHRLQRLRGRFPGLLVQLLSRLLSATPPGDRERQPSGGNSAASDGASSPSRFASKRIAASTRRASLRRSSTMEAAGVNGSGGMAAALQRLEQLQDSALEALGLLFEVAAVHSVEDSKAEQEGGPQQQQQLFERMATLFPFAPAVVTDAIEAHAKYLTDLEKAKQQTARARQQQQDATQDAQAREADALAKKNKKKKGASITGGRKSIAGSVAASRNQSMVAAPGGKNNSTFVRKNPRQDFVFHRDKDLCAAVQFAALFPKLVSLQQPHPPAASKKVGGNSSTTTATAATATTTAAAAAAATSTTTSGITIEDEVEGELLLVLRLYYLFFRTRNANAYIRLGALLKHLIGTSVKVVVAAAAAAATTRSKANRTDDRHIHDLAEIVLDTIDLLQKLKYAICTADGYETYAVLQHSSFLELEETLAQADVVPSLSSLLFMAAGRFDINEVLLLRRAGEGDDEEGDRGKKMDGGGEPVEAIATAAAATAVVVPPEGGDGGEDDGAPKKKAPRASDGDHRTVLYWVNRFQLKQMDVREARLCMLQPVDPAAAPSGGGSNNTILSQLLYLAGEKPFPLCTIYLPAAQRLSALAARCGVCSTTVGPHAPLHAATATLQYGLASIMEGILLDTSVFLQEESTERIQWRRSEQQIRNQLGISNSFITLYKLSQRAPDKFVSAGGPKALALFDLIAPLFADSAAAAADAPATATMVREDVEWSDDALDEKEESNYVKITLSVIEAQLRSGLASPLSLAGTTLHLAAAMTEQLDELQELVFSSPTSAGAPATTGADKTMGKSKSVLGMSTVQKAETFAKRRKYNREKQLLLRLERSRLTLALVRAALAKVTARQDALYAIYQPRAVVTVGDEAKQKIDEESERGPQRQRREAKARLWRSLCDVRTDLTRAYIQLRWYVALLRSQTQAYQQREEDIQVLLYRQLRTEVFGSTTAKESRILDTLLEEEPDIPSSVAEEEARLKQWSFQNPYLKAMVLLFLATTGLVKGGGSGGDGSAAEQVGAACHLQKTPKEQKELMDAAMRVLSEVKWDGSTSLSFSASGLLHAPASVVDPLTDSKEREKSSCYSLILMWAYAASCSSKLHLLGHAASARSMLYQNFIVPSGSGATPPVEGAADAAGTSGPRLQQQNQHPYRLQLNEKAVRHSSETVLLMFAEALVEVSEAEVRKVSKKVADSSNSSSGTRGTSAGEPAVTVMQETALQSAYRALLALRVVSEVYQTQQRQQQLESKTADAHGSGGGGALSSAPRTLQLLLRCSQQVFQALNVSVLSDSNFSPFVIEPLVSLCYVLLSLRESNASSLWRDATLQLLALQIVDALRQIIYEMPSTAMIPHNSVVMLKQLLAKTFVHVWNQTYANPSQRLKRYQKDVLHRSMQCHLVFANDAATASKRRAEEGAAGGGGGREANGKSSKHANALQSIAGDDGGENRHDANEVEYPGKQYIPTTAADLSLSDTMPVEYIELLERMLFHHSELYYCLLPASAATPTANNANNNNNNNGNNTNKSASLRVDPNSFVAAGGASGLLLSEPFAMGGGGSNSATTAVLALLNEARYLVHVPPLFAQVSALMAAVELQKGEFNITAAATGVGGGGAAATAAAATTNNNNSNARGPNNTAAGSVSIATQFEELVQNNKTDPYLAKVTVHMIRYLLCAGSTTISSGNNSNNNNNNNNANANANAHAALGSAASNSVNNYTAARRLARLVSSIIAEDTEEIKTFMAEKMSLLRAWLVQRGYTIALAAPDDDRGDEDEEEEDGNEASASTTSAKNTGKKEQQKGAAKKKSETQKKKAANAPPQDGAADRDKDDDDAADGVVAVPQRIWTEAEKQMLKQLTRSFAYLRRRVAFRHLMRRHTQFNFLFQAQLRLLSAAASRLEKAEVRRREEDGVEQKMWALALNDVTDVQAVMAAAAGGNAKVTPTSSKGRKMAPATTADGDDAATPADLAAQIAKDCQRAATLFNYCLYPSRAAAAVQTAVNDLRAYVLQREQLPNPLLLHETLFGFQVAAPETGDDQRVSVVSADSLDSRLDTTRLLREQTREVLATVSPFLHRLAVELLCALALSVRGYCDHRRDAEVMQPASVKTGGYVTSRASQLTAFAGMVPSLMAYVSPAGQYEERRHALLQRAENRRQQRRNMRELGYCEEDEQQAREMIVMSYQTKLYNMVREASERLQSLVPMLSGLRADMLEWHQEQNEVNSRHFRKGNTTTKAKNRRQSADELLPGVERQDKQQQQQQQQQQQSSLMVMANGQSAQVAYFPFPFRRAHSGAQVLVTGVGEKGQAGEEDDEGGSHLQARLRALCLGDELPEELLIKDTLLFLLRCLQFTHPTEMQALCVAANEVTAGRYALQLLPLALWAHHMVGTNRSAAAASLRAEVRVALQSAPVGEILMDAARHAWRRYTLTDSYQRAVRRQQTSLLQKTTLGYSRAVAGLLTESRLQLNATTSELGGPAVKQSLKNVVALYQSAEAHLRERREFYLLGQCLLEVGHIYMCHNNKSEAEKYWLSALDALLSTPKCFHRWCLGQLPLRCAPAREVKPAESVTGSVVAGSEVDVREMTFPRLLLALLVLSNLGRYCYPEQQSRATDAAIFAGHLLEEYLLYAQAVSLSLPARMCDYADVVVADLTKVLLPQRESQSELRAWLPATTDGLLFLSTQLSEMVLDANHAVVLATIAEYIAYHYLQRVQPTVEARLARARAAAVAGNTRAAMHLLRGICRGVGLPSSVLCLLGGEDTTRTARRSLVPPSVVDPAALAAAAGGGGIRKPSVGGADARRKASEANTGSGSEDVSNENVELFYDNLLPPTEPANVVATKAFLLHSLPNLKPEHLQPPQNNTAANAASAAPILPTSLLPAVVAQTYGFVLSNRVVLTVTEFLVRTLCAEMTYLWPSETGAAGDRGGSTGTARTVSPDLKRPVSVHRAGSNSTQTGAAGAAAAGGAGSSALNSASLAAAEYVLGLFCATSAADERSAGSKAVKSSTGSKLRRASSISKTATSANPFTDSEGGGDGGGDGSLRPEEQVVLALQRAEVAASFRHRASLLRAQLWSERGAADDVLHLLHAHMAEYDYYTDKCGDAATMVTAADDAATAAGQSSGVNAAAAAAGGLLYGRGFGTIVLPLWPSFLLSLHHTHWARVLRLMALQYLRQGRYAALPSLWQQAANLCEVNGDAYSLRPFLLLQFTSLLAKGETAQAVQIARHLQAARVTSGALPPQVDPLLAWSQTTTAWLAEQDKRFPAALDRAAAAGETQRGGKKKAEEEDDETEEAQQRYASFVGTMEVLGAQAARSGICIPAVYKARKLRAALPLPERRSLTQLRQEAVRPRRAVSSVTVNTQHALPVHRLINQMAESLLTSCFVDQAASSASHPLERRKRKVMLLESTRQLLCEALGSMAGEYDVSAHPVSSITSKLLLARTHLACVAIAGPPSPSGGGSTTADTAKKKKVDGRHPLEGALGWLGEEDQQEVLELLQQVVEENVLNGTHNFAEMRTALLEQAVLYHQREVEHCYKKKKATAAAAAGAETKSVKLPDDTGSPCDGASRNAAVACVVLSCLLDDMATHVFRDTTAYMDYNSDSSMSTDWPVLAARLPPTVLATLRQNTAVVTAGGAASVVLLNENATGKTKKAAKSDRRPSAELQSRTLGGEGAAPPLPPVRLLEMVRAFASLQRAAELYQLAPIAAGMEQETALRLTKSFLQEKTSKPSCTYLCYPEDMRRAQTRQMNPQRGAPAAGRRTGGIAAGAQQLAQDNVEMWEALTPPVLLAQLPKDLYSADPADTLAAPCVNSVVAASFRSALLDLLAAAEDEESRWGPSGASESTLTLLLALSPYHDHELAGPPSISTPADRKRLLRTAERRASLTAQAAATPPPSIDAALSDRLSELQQRAAAAEEPTTWRTCLVQLPQAAVRALHAEAEAVLRLLERKEDPVRAFVNPQMVTTDNGKGSRSGSRRTSATAPVTATEYLGNSDAPPAQQHLVAALAEATQSLALRTQTPGNPTNTTGPNSLTAGGATGGGGAPSRKRSNSLRGASAVGLAANESHANFGSGGAAAAAAAAAKADDGHVVYCDLELRRQAAEQTAAREAADRLDEALDEAKSELVMHLLQEIVQSTFSSEERTLLALAEESWMDRYVDRILPRCAMSRRVVTFLRDWLACGEGEGGREEGKDKKEDTNNNNNNSSSSSNREQGKRKIKILSTQVGGSASAFMESGLHEWMSRVVLFVEERERERVLGTQKK